MSRTKSLVMLLVGVAASLANCRSADAAPPSKPIEASIDRAKKFLYGSLNPSGNWEQLERPEALDGDTYGLASSGQWGGLTAMATYTLLATGENSHEPRLAKAIAFLRTAKLSGTYAVAYRAQIWHYLPATAENKAAAQRDAKLLLSGALPSGPGFGFHTYTIPPQHFRGDAYDKSTSQFAALALWSCTQVGVEVPKNYWAAVENAWHKTQNPDGGWPYGIEGPPPSQSRMTAAGTATMFITQDQLRPDLGADCKPPPKNESIEHAIKWLETNFDRIDSGNEATRYALYAVERVGIASGLKYFGKIDWYSRGVAHLLETQSPDGSWGPDAGKRWPDNGNPRKIPETCFAAIFLYRGRLPIVMNKLEYQTTGDDPDSAWNLRPRDVANFARWASGIFEVEFSWQIVSPDSPLEDLLESNILFINGNKEFTLTPEQCDRLKAFVEAGGLIVGNAACSSEAFAKSFRKIGKTMFPDHEFRDLPDAHPVFTLANFPAKNWKKKPSILGLSNGVRELMLLLPNSDVSRVWQARMTGRDEAFQLPANIFQYCNDGKNPRTRVETGRFTPDPALAALPAVRVARIELGTNSDPEPGGWRSLDHMLRTTEGFGVETVAVPLGTGKLDQTFSLAHLTGTTRVSISTAQAKELKDYVGGGGTLLVDAAGGSAEFAGSIGRALEQTFGPSTTLSFDDPLLATAKLSKDTVKYRFYIGSDAGMKVSRKLRCIKVADRPAVIISDMDLSFGLTGANYNGVVGFDSDTSSKIVGAIVSTLRNKPASPARAGGEPAK